MVEEQKDADKLNFNNVSDDDLDDNPYLSPPNKNTLAAKTTLKNQTSVTPISATNA